jgi:hypothetical protein
MGHAPTQVRISLYQVDFVPHFGGFDGRGQAADSAADHHNASTRGALFSLVMLSLHAFKIW